MASGHSELFAASLPRTLAHPSAQRKVRVLRRRIRRSAKQLTRQLQRKGTASFSPAVRTTRTAAHPSSLSPANGNPMDASNGARGAAHLGKTPGVWYSRPHAYKRGPATESVGAQRAFPPSVGRTAIAQPVSSSVVVAKRRRGVALAPFEICFAQATFCSSLAGHLLQKLVRLCNIKWVGSPLPPPAACQQRLK